MVNGKLKEYQIKGLEWLVSLYNNNLNGKLPAPTLVGFFVILIREVGRPILPYVVLLEERTVNDVELDFMLRAHLG